MYAHADHRQHVSGQNVSEHFQRKLALFIVGHGHGHCFFFFFGELVT